MKAMDAVDGAHASSTPPPPRVVATPAALELVALLQAKHGPELMFHQSGGCCDNSAANCYLPGEITMGAGDVYLGDMTLGGTITQARNLAESMQVAFDAGAKRILLPMSSVTDIPSVPGELFAKFQTSFYSDPVDAVFKALGVE